MGKEHIKEISDIDCSVTSCVYHDGKTKCMAGKIQVGPRNACCSSETECATYEPDGGMQKKNKQEAREAAAKFLQQPYFRFFVYYDSMPSIS